MSKQFGSGHRRYAEELLGAQARFAAAQQAHVQAEARRQARVEEIRRQHQAGLQRAEAAAADANKAVDQWIEGLQQRRREDVEKYLFEVLRAIPLPRRFPRRGEVTYNSDDEHAVVRFELPGVNAIPQCARSPTSRPRTSSGSSHAPHGSASSCTRR
jgi:hypothetical protein